MTEPATYACAIIGDGKSTDTAFRPAINDIKTAQGQYAFQHNCAIPTGADGKPTVTTINVTVLDNSNASLVSNNPQIVPVTGTSAKPA